MRNDLLTDPKFELPRDLFAAACRFSREWDAMLRAALLAYGEHGSAISGAGREHFPEHIKDALRQKARAVTFNSDLAYKARPKGVRMETMRKLAALVATRDGSGFYGPQPMRVDRAAA